MAAMDAFGRKGVTRKHYSHAKSDAAKEQRRKEAEERLVSWQAKPAMLQLDILETDRPGLSKRQWTRIIGKFDKAA